jgi:hypothetical protein
MLILIDGPQTVGVYDNIAKCLNFSNLNNYVVCNIVYSSSLITTLSMKKALITNIGNRNILYKRANYKSRKQGQNHTFYSVTELLYKTQDFEKITPNILSPLLEKFHSELDRAILIGSE